MNWNKKHIGIKEIDKFLTLLEKDNPEWIGMDTETTGLNIKRDTVFLIIIGWTDKEGTKKVFTMDTETIKPFYKKLYTLLDRAKYVFFWNTKFDLHMLRNSGMEYTNDNLSDGMIIASLIEPVERTTLALKNIAAKYIHIDAKEQQDHLKAYQKEIKAPRVAMLTKMLKLHKYNFGKLKKDLKDPLIGLEGLPEEVKNIYMVWSSIVNHKNIHEEYSPSYDEIYKLNPQLMLDYASDDVVYMLEFVYQELPELLTKREVKAFERENKVILPLYEQEKEGWNIDIDYLHKSTKIIQKEIINYSSILNGLAGEEITANQNARIKTLITEKFKYDKELTSTDKNSLTTIFKTTEDTTLKRFIEVILILRTLRKWYTTYIMRFERNYNNNGDGRIRTAFHSQGTKTGRVSSDFQQFPSGGAVVEGKELFNPRKLIIPYGGDYSNIVYFDYSQMELRIASEYLYQMVNKNNNLIKAYVNMENVENWEPLDLHGFNVKTAYGIDENHPDFKKLRGAGKTINFAVIYGSGLTGLLFNSNLEGFSPTQIEDLFKAFKKNYPEVSQFQWKVRNYIEQIGSIYNMYDRIYKFSSTDKLYKASNYLIQGSCADFLKDKLILCYNYIKQNNLKSKILGNIHDEIQFAIHKDEFHIIKDIKEIMEKTNTFTPINVDVEITTTNWSEKKEWKDINNDK